MVADLEHGWPAVGSELGGEVAGGTAVRRHQCRVIVEDGGGAFTVAAVAQIESCQHRCSGGDGGLSRFGGTVVTVVPVSVGDTGVAPSLFRFAVTTTGLTHFVPSSGYVAFKQSATPLTVQFLLTGGPQNLLPIKQEALKLWSWVLVGIRPDKLLNAKFRWLKKVRLETLEGISPESWFLEKSRDSNNSMSPIFFGIIPVRKFPDRLSDRRPTKLSHRYFSVEAVVAQVQRSQLTKITHGAWYVPLKIVVPQCYNRQGRPVHPTIGNIS
ncbi:hypothetical protein RJ640_029244 [Escallonia rubra]|uniref:Uncharacterized protein n=1 Tax=Escallonia rubra TaxID=112253 RepID=A0AA88S022_9ASTE|nr:hypothetical protein RJ640_029244 [Escallonia rubra]